jgi:hypothetical protein
LLDILAVAEALLLLLMTKDMLSFQLCWGTMLLTAEGGNTPLRPMAPPWQTFPSQMAYGVGKTVMPWPPFKNTVGEAKCFMV